MRLYKSTLAIITLVSLSRPVFAEIEEKPKQVSKEEYEKLIDGLIKGISEGSIGVGGGKGGSGSTPGGGQGSAPGGQGSGGNEDGNAGNDDNGDGVGEAW